MNKLLRLILSSLLLAAIFSCSGSWADGSSEGGGAAHDKALSSELTLEEVEAALEDDYEIVLRDSVNWFVMLNHVETDNNLIRYEGLLFYHYGGRDISGKAKAVYNSNPDVLTIQCEDTYDEDNPDIMAYGFVFDSATSRHMRGGWAYLKGKWQGGTAARLLKGQIGGHLGDE